MKADQLKVGMTYTGESPGQSAALTITGFQACYDDGDKVYPDNFSGRFKHNPSYFYAVGTLDNGHVCRYNFNRWDTVTVRDRNHCADCAPSVAKWYVEIVYGRDIDGDPTMTETGENSVFACDAHKPKPSDLKPENKPEWKRAERWTILERKTIDLEKRRGNAA
jgi:hypothetical protein